MAWALLPRSFTANPRIYRLTALLSVDGFEITLWDETGGLNTRVSVGSQVFAGQLSVK